ncbi:MAG: hypothetical protein AAB865_01620 [Patescibacteria group bacterium]
MLTSEDLTQIEGIVETIVDKKLDEQADVIKQSFNAVDERFDRLERKMDVGFQLMNKQLNRVLDLLGDRMGFEKRTEQRLVRLEKALPAA